MFFTEYTDVDRNKSIGITSLLSNITTREGSHKGGWARLLKCQLKHLGHKRVEVLTNKDNLSDFDIIIFDLGAEYSGALNLFGGLDEKVFARLSEIKEFKGPMFSWRNELLDLCVLESRRGNSSTCQKFKDSPETFLTDVQNALKNVRVFRHAYRTDALLIGDSHTPSVWTPSLMIERRDGRTLKGMVENGTVQKFYKEFTDLGIEIKKIQVHCSSIDIRHHVFREAQPHQHVVHLASELYNSLIDIPGLEVVLTHSMGIEDESRELPKTGYFKGTPFTGTWDDRNMVRSIFNSVIEELATLDEGRASIVTFPEYFFDESGKLKFEVMEKPQSVHLSPEHYKFDFENNKERW